MDFILFTFLSEGSIQYVYISDKNTCCARMALDTTGTEHFNEHAVQKLHTHVLALWVVKYR